MQLQHAVQSAKPPPPPLRAVRARHHDATATAHFTVGWAASEADVREAQHLRYSVFAREMGARLAALPGTRQGLDADRFDAFCDHLLVRAFGPDMAPGGEVVGTYRVLGPAQARQAGGYYTDTEFDLTPLAGLRSHAVELGRSCVHADWRRGGVILSMWSALAQYMHRRELDTMIGCASVSLLDGGAAARALWHRLRHTHLANPKWQVQPYTPLPMTGPDGGPVAGLPAAGAFEAPPLIKGYLRCGARVLGPPALDAAFNTADLPMLMRMGDMSPRYRTHFLGAG